MNADYYINNFELETHYENGYLKEFYKNEYSDWCFYLLKEGEINPLHLLSCDESWQYCAGDPLNLYLVKSDKSIESHIIGPNPELGHLFIKIVPANTWFCAETQKDAKFTLISHCVTPKWKDEFLHKGYRKIVEPFINDKNFIEKYCWENCREMD